MKLSLRLRRQSRNSLFRKKEKGKLDRKNKRRRREESRKGNSEKVLVMKMMWRQMSIMKSTKRGRVLINKEH